MTIYTPRGLKIRLSVAEAFALMKRLGPSVPPFTFLKTVEAIEAIPAVFGLSACIVAHVLFKDPVSVLIATVVAYIGGVSFRANAEPPESLIKICTAYTYVNGFALFLSLVAYLGYIKTGLVGTALYLTGFFLGWIYSLYHGFQQTKRLVNETGTALTQSELSFAKAYQYYAQKQGQSLSLEVTDDELLETNWRPLLEIFAFQWPDVARRFVR